MSMGMLVKGKEVMTDFRKGMKMAVVYAYLQRREDHEVTCKSRGWSTQMNSILCR